MFTRLRPQWRQYIIVLLANLTIMNMGMSSIWSSPALLKLTDENSPVLDRPFTEDESSWVVAVLSLAVLGANMFMSYIVDRIGRKQSIFLSIIPKILSGILLIFATDVWMLLVGRLLDGVFDTMIMVAVPIYTSEIASKKIRGASGTVFQVCSSLGILLMLIIGPFVSYTALNVICLALAIITILPTVILPESPNFLYSKGQKEKAEEVLMLVHGSETTAKEILKEYSMETTDSKLDMRKLFKNPIFLKSLGISIVLGFEINGNGSNIVSAYLQTVVENTGTNITSQTVSVIIGFIQFSACFCTLLCIDRFGRKPIMSCTTFAIGIGMVGLGTFFTLKDNEYSITGVLNLLPLASIAVILFSYSAGWGSLYFLVVTELFEGPCRALGLSISLFVNMTTLFLLTKFFTFFNNVVGPSILYWFFSTNCLFFCVFVIFCVPETKQRTFAEIQEALGAKKKCCDIETIKTRL